MLDSRARRYDLLPPHKSSGELLTKYNMLPEKLGKMQVRRPNDPMDELGFCHPLTACVRGAQRCTHGLTAPTTREQYKRACGGVHTLGGSCLASFVRQSELPRGKAHFHTERAAGSLSLTGDCAYR